MKIQFIPSRQLIAVFTRDGRCEHRSPNTISALGSIFPTLVSNAIAAPSVMFAVGGR